LPTFGLECFSAKFLSKRRSAPFSWKDAVLILLLLVWVYPQVFLKKTHKIKNSCERNIMECPSSIFSCLQSQSSRINGRHLPKSLRFFICSSSHHHRLALNGKKEDKCSQKLLYFILQQFFDLGQASPVIFTFRLPEAGQVVASVPIAGAATRWTPSSAHRCPFSFSICKTSYSSRIC